MNHKTAAATAVALAGMTLGLVVPGAAVTATENNIVICHNGFELHFSPHPSQAKNIAAHLKHGDKLGLCQNPTPTASPTVSPTSTATPKVTATPSPTGTATASPTVTPTASPTSTPTPTVVPTVIPTPAPEAPISTGVSDDPCVNHPHLNQHNQPRIVRDGVWLQDTDCGQYIIEVTRSTPEPVKAPDLAPTPSETTVAPPVTDFTPEPLPPVIKLPNAGDGPMPSDSNRDVVVPLSLLGLVLSSGFIGWFMRGKSS